MDRFKLWLDDLSQTVDSKVLCLVLAIVADDGSVVYYRLTDGIRYSQLE